MNVSGDKLRVTIGTGPAIELAIPAGRTIPAFYVHGAGADLRIKGAKLEVAP